jgi:hypothetical protein
MSYSDEDCYDTMGELLRAEHIEYLVAPYPKLMNILEDYAPKIFNKIDGNREYLFEVMGNFTIHTATFYASRYTASKRSNAGDRHHNKSLNKISKAEKALKIKKLSLELLDAMGYRDNNRVQENYDGMVLQGISTYKEIAPIFGEKFLLDGHQKNTILRNKLHIYLLEAVKNSHDLIPTLEPFPNTLVTKEKLRFSLSELGIKSKSKIINEFITKL